MQRPAAADYSPLIAKASADKTVTRADVVLDCKVGGLGELTGCSPVSQSPAGLGLGAAAVELASRFRMSLWGANGRPALGASVRLPLQVQVQDNNNVVAATRIGRSSLLSADLVADDRLAYSLDGYYPERAYSGQVNGDATLSCRVSASRALEGCTVFYEFPNWFGFGNAAMKLAPHLALKPDAEARPSGDGTVLAPFSFRMR